MSPNLNFEDLRELIPKAIILVPGDARYEDSLKRWSASCVKPAAVVVQPSTASEASVAIRYAAANRVYPFAVRGGGHSTSGDCSSDGGMVLDLARMRSTSVDPIAQTITFGGGCTWEDVNGSLWEHGLATISGTVGDTGVGGLILGGGYGFLTGQHGLALDCLLSCEVVLASGEIVTANKDENADLFWALRGAGVNFGVVTTFVSQAYPQKESWAGFLGFLPDKLPALINFGNELCTYHLLFPCC
jgi:FAD/FMN-containing dehydrogenase